mmetsp:Transcript_7871/g.17633  ORF Transcript_7871/g.17633 Transcript_7871/m.17633 type:complete len:119 (+) Transcript_7871:741-1097(+)
MQGLGYESDGDKGPFWTKAVRNQYYEEEAVELAEDTTVDTSMNEPAEDTVDTSTNEPVSDTMDTNAGAEEETTQDATRALLRETVLLVAFVWIRPSVTTTSQFRRTRKQKNAVHCIDS